MSFTERIVQWQPFFITVATVAGTLVGLLFISLSINRDAVAANQTLLRLARRSFSDRMRGRVQKAIKGFPILPL